MIERLAVTGTGVPTAFAGEKALHSRYDPLLEAERYINTLPPGEGIRFFILIEPVLGYIIPVIQKKFPRAKVIVLHVSGFFAEQSVAEQGLPVWVPGRGPGIQEFLEEEIPDVPAAAVRIVEWRPALGAYGRVYLEVLAETVEFIRRIDANTRTTRGFGRRWFRNFFKNLGIIRKTLRYIPGFTPVLITGAGPSLEGALPLIRERKAENPLFILAAASSVKPLLTGKLIPDLIISTDGGNWALLHLYEVLRMMDGENPPLLAAGLSAALPSQCSRLPILPIGDGSSWQKLILKTIGFPGISMTQRGTVTASALDLALTLTGGSIFLSGMDLSHQDIKTHARPYGFDRFREEGASRLNPSYFQAFVRAGGAGTAEAHRIYAGWFKRQLASYPGRIRSLGANNPVFETLPGTGERAETAGKIRGDGGLTPIITTLPRNDTLPQRAAQILESALNDPALAPAICRELSPLLLPDEPAPSPGDLAAEIRLLIKACARGPLYG
ncbi:MAG: DUF115 domain-containing protein [Spirochaetaceae bacterium]|jgi:hypothetical protein|nr:DUF115 domain-containing protein [Spirochaetaceae bacterium]